MFLFLLHILLLESIHLHYLHHHLVVQMKHYLHHQNHLLHHLLHHYPDGFLHLHLRLLMSLKMH